MPYTFIENSLIDEVTSLLNISEDNTIYVSKQGEDSNPGTIHQPKLTIQAGIDACTPSITQYWLVSIGAGAYPENLILKEFVCLRGAGSMLITRINPTTGDALNLPAVFTDSGATVSIEDIYLSVQEANKAALRLVSPIATEIFVFLNRIVLEATNSSYGVVLDMQQDGGAQANSTTILTDSTSTGIHTISGTWIHQSGAIEGGRAIRAGGVSSPAVLATSLIIGADHASEAILLDGSSTILLRNCICFCDTATATLARVAHAAALFFVDSGRADSVGDGLTITAGIAQLSNWDLSTNRDGLIASGISSTLFRRGSIHVRERILDTNGADTFVLLDNVQTSSEGILDADAVIARGGSLVSINNGTTIELYGGTGNTLVLKEAGSFLEMFDSSCRHATPTEDSLFIDGSGGVSFNSKSFSVQGGLFTLANPTTIAAENRGYSATGTKSSISLGDYLIGIAGSGPRAYQALLLSRLRVAFTGIPFAPVVFTVKNEDTGSSVTATIAVAPTYQEVGLSSPLAFKDAERLSVEVTTYTGGGSDWFIEVI